MTTETIYLLIEKRYVRKNAAGKTELNLSLMKYQYVAGRMFATRKAAMTKIPDPKLMENFTVLRMEPVFPEGYFKVEYTNDFRVTKTLGKFRNLKDAITVATGRGGYGDNADITFIHAEVDDVYDTVAEWKKGSKNEKLADIRVSGNNGEVIDFNNFKLI